MKGFRRVFAVLIVAVLAVAGGWAWFERPWEARASEPLWRTVRLERGDIVSAVTATGTITPTSTVIVGSQLSGQVVQILVDHNDPVRRDQVLARLNADQIGARADAARADLAQARAQVRVIEGQIEKNRADVERAGTTIADMKAQGERAGALLADAEQTYARQTELARRGVAAEVSLQQARTALASQRAALDSATAQAQAADAARRSLMADAGVLEGQLAAARASVMQREAVIRQIEVDLRNAEIRSPVDGVIVQRSIELGQTVAASLQAPTLFLVAQDLRHMEIYANVDETDVGRVRPGQTVLFTVNAFPNRTFEGRVKLVRLGSQTVSNVVIYTAVVTVENPAMELLPGMTANLRVLTDQRRDVVRLPNAALRFRPPNEAPAAPSRPAAQNPLGGGLFGGAGGPGPFMPGGIQGQQAGQAQRILQDFIDGVRQEARTSAAQNARIDEILAEMRRDMRNAFQTAADAGARRETMRRLMAEFQTKIGDVMTPAQRPIFDQVRQRFADAQRPGQPGTAGRVFVPGADGKAEVARLRLGITDGQFTEVIEGLEGGAEVITGTAPRPPARGGFLGLGS